MTTRDTASESDCLRISLDSYPGFNPFALDLVRGATRASQFCSRSNLDGIKPSRPNDSLSDLATALRETNRSWGNRVDDSIASWIEDETITLIAGQQTGFAGGPLYTLAKIASLIALARSIRSSGRKTTSFFWMATEDHDYDEIARLDLIHGNSYERLRAASAPSRRIVGDRAVPQELRLALLEILDTTPSWLEPDLSFRDSFARLIAEVVPGEVILVDSLLPELRQAGQPLLEEIVGSLGFIDEAITARSQEIELAGYTPQISPSGGSYTAIYAIDDTGNRNPVRQSEGHAVVDDWDVDPAELARRQPERISTAALTRPLLQDFVFQPDVFIGGPAEVSYYAQLGPLYERFGIRQPHVALRGHALVAPQKVLRAIDKYTLAETEIFEPVDEILLRREAGRDEELGAIIEELNGELTRQLERIQSLVVPVDRSMKRSLERTSKRIRYHCEQMKRRGRRAIARFDEDRHSALEKLHLHLFPGDTPQDRVVGWIGYWNSYGPRLVERLVSEIEPDSDAFRIIGL